MLSRPGISSIGARRRRHTTVLLIAAAWIVATLGCCGARAFAESGYFIHISDPHVTALNYLQWRQRLQSIQAESPPPDLVLCTGDLVEYGAGVTGSLNYDVLLAPPITTESGNHYIGQGPTRIPIFFCPGNHDYRNASTLTEDLTNYKSKVHSTTYYHEIVGNYAIFSVNSGSDTLLVGLDLLPEGTGLFNTTANPDVAQLEHDLDMLDGFMDGRDTSTYKKIVFMHHPHQYPAPGPICSLDGAFRRYSYNFTRGCQDFGVGWALFGHLHPDESMVYDLGCDTWTSGETKCIVAVSARTTGYRREHLDGTGEDVIFTNVPTVSAWGLAVMALLVLGGAYRVLWRHRHTTA